MIGKRGRENRPVGVILAIEKSGKALKSTQNHNKVFIPRWANLSICGLW
jgi:hypothetical protein